MPCYTRTMISVEFNEKVNLPRFEKTLIEMGYRVYGDIYQKESVEISIESNGKINFNSYSRSAIDTAKKELIKGYARTTVKENAKKYGFRIQETSDGKLTLTR